MGQPIPGVSGSGGAGAGEGGSAGEGAASEANADNGGAAGAGETSTPNAGRQGFLASDVALSDALARSCISMAAARFAVEVEVVTPGSVATSSA